MKYLFLEQRAPAGAEENELTLAFQGPRKGMASWLADSGLRGRGGVPAGRCPPRRLRLDARALAAVRGIHRADDASRTRPSTADLAEANEKLGAGFIENLTKAMGTEAAFALQRVLRQRSDVGDGRPGEQPGGHRQLAPEAGGNVQRGACARRSGQADRVRAGERGRTGLEHDETGELPIRRDLDLRWGLHGGGLRSRVRGACHRDPERRLAARLVAGVPAASSPRLPGSTRPRSPG